MSKYKLMDIFESFKDNLSPEEKERYDMLTSDDQDKLERIKALMDKEKVNIEKDAKKSMGMLREMDLEVSQRIEGLLNMGMKNKFLDMGMDLIQDVLEEDEFDINDIVSHLAYELGQHYDSFERQGAKLAGMEEGYGNEDGDKDDSPTEKETEKMRFKEDMDMDYDGMYAYLDLIRRAGKDFMNKGYIMKEFGLDSGEARGVLGKYASQFEEYEDVEIKEMDDKTEVSMKDIIKALKNDAKATDSEIKQYMASVKKEDDKFDDVDGYVEDFKNYVEDKSLQEHFGRFMKDYQ
tara:strand:- start:838 stop:1713 length:876 start_codon:yes stop_codon:yes gene_type:complete